MTETFTQNVSYLENSQSGDYDYKDIDVVDMDLSNIKNEDNFINDKEKEKKSKKEVEEEEREKMQ